MISPQVLFFTLFGCLQFLTLTLSIRKYKMFLPWVMDHTFKGYLFNSLCSVSLRLPYNTEICMILATWINNNLRKISKGNLRNSCWIYKIVEISDNNSISLSRETSKTWVFLWQTYGGNNTWRNCFSTLSWGHINSTSRL